MTEGLLERDTVDPTGIAAVAFGAVVPQNMILHLAPHRSDNDRLEVSEWLCRLRLMKRRSSFRVRPQASPNRFQRVHIVWQPTNRDRTAALIQVRLPTISCSPHSAVEHR
jgi:hypothetical protein